MDVVMAFIGAALCLALAFATILVDASNRIRRLRTKPWIALLSWASLVGAFYLFFAVAGGNITRHRERMAAAVCANHRGPTGTFAGMPDRGNLAVPGAGARHLLFFCNDDSKIEVVRETLDRYQTLAVTSDYVR